jgi:hypothetical protein
MDRKKYLLVGFLVLAMGTLDLAVAQEQTPANPKTASVEQALSAFLTASTTLIGQHFGLVSAAQQPFSIRRLRILSD